jgi:hypothetical protein
MSDVRSQEEFSRGLGEQLLDVSVAGCEQSGGEQLPAFGEAVAMGLRDLFDDAVGAEQPKLAADARLPGA